MDDGDKVFIARDCLANGERFSSAVVLHRAEMLDSDRR